MAQDFQAGDTVFAKMKGYPHWPARVSKIKEGEKIPKGKIPIFFYGTHEIGYLAAKSLFPYEKFKVKYGAKHKSSGFNKGLLEIENNRWVKYGKEQEPTEEDKEDVEEEAESDESEESEDESEEESDSTEEEESEEEKEEECMEIEKENFKPTVKKEKTELEETRDKNIADNAAFLANLMKDLKGLKAPRRSLGPITERSNTKPRRQSADPSFVIRRNPGRIGRYNPYTTRSRSRRGSGDSSVSSSPDKDDYRPLFRFGSYFDPSEEAEDDDDPMVKVVKAVRRKTMSAPRDIRPPSDITEEEIKMVADCVKEKRYDQTYGTTCHQCRQKTFDMKTICRSEECSGARGQFCGVCLKNRYGQDAREALKDPNWHCPPCLGMCNCSICRRRKGKSCTGILVYLAKEEGFDNVSDYLKYLKSKK